MDIIRRITERRRRRHIDEEIRAYLDEHPLATYDEAYDYLLEEGFESEDISYSLHESKVGCLDGICSDTWEGLLCKLEDMGYTFNDSLYDSPVVWIDSMKNGKLFEIEVDENPNGYEVMSIGEVDFDGDAV